MSGALACPGCGNPMDRGRLRIKGTVPGFLFFGMSWQHLWWTDLDETRESRVQLISSGDQRRAFRCGACGIVAFRPSER